MIQMLDLENGNFMNRTRGKKMDYNKIVQGILDIGEAMLQSGAENFRLEDSFTACAEAMDLRDRMYLSFRVIYR